jgi:hypothetical protein
MAIDGPIADPDCVVTIDPSALERMLAGAQPDRERPVFKVAGNHALFRALFTQLRAQYRPTHAPWSTAVRAGRS